MQSLVRFWSSLARGWATAFRFLQVPLWCAPADTMAARLGHGLLVHTPSRRKNRTDIIFTIFKLVQY